MFTPSPLLRPFLRIAVGSLLLLALPTVASAGGAGGGGGESPGGGGAGGAQEGGGGAGPTDDADGDGYSVAEGDCDDTEPNVRPNATDTCNARDDDCDGQVDEDYMKTLYIDRDGDGFGSEDLVIRTCENPDGFSEESTDCDDSRADVNPDASEYPGEGDRNCDGASEDNNNDNFDSGPGDLPNALSGLLLAGWMGVSAWRRRRQLRA